MVCPFILSVSLQEMYRTVVFHRALKKKEKLTTTPQQHLSDTDKNTVKPFLPVKLSEISSEEISAIVLRN